MKRKIMAAVLAAVLAVVPAGSALAESTDVILAGEEDYGSLLQEELLPEAELTVEEVYEEEALTGQEAGESQSQTETAAGGTDGSGGQTAAEEAGEGDADAEQEELPEAAESAAAAGAQEDADAVDADELNLEADGLVLSVEEAEAPEGLAGAEDVTLTETVEGRLADAGSTADASMPMLQMFANETYVDSYGAQLDGLALKLYNEMKARYVTKRGSGGFTYTFSKPYTFRADDGKLDTKTGTLSWDADSNEAYQDIVMEICYGMQAAYDGFSYDYPEVFWMKAPEYSWDLSFKGSDGAGYTGTITGITVKPQEVYSGASSEIAAFDSAVTSTVSKIKRRSRQVRRRRIRCGQFTITCARILPTRKTRTHIRRQAFS